MSGRPTITPIQLSITLALISRRTWSVRVTSLKRVKSNTTLPYIELFIVVPAKPTTAVGMSCLLDVLFKPRPSLSYSCRCSNHFATSLLTKDVYALVSNRVRAVKYVDEAGGETKHCR